MKLSIIIPVYNEEKTVQSLIKAVKQVNLRLSKEIIVVDDGSSDKTVEILNKISGIKLIKHIKNRGKGAAVRTGLKNASGDIFIIQDADLEYDPQQINKLISPILNGETRVVYGSRFMGKDPKDRVSKHDFGNKFLSYLTSLLYGVKMTDMETCYKAFHKDALDGIKLTANKFEIEPEITAKFLKKGEKILEMPINYIPRSVEDGKKINFKDGIISFWTLIKYRFVD